jgi:hypothetical protein
VTTPIVAVADLHGHASLFRALLARLDADLEDRYRLVTLGDYVDNGPEIPELLDALIDLAASRADRFVPIIGNHDLACLLSMGWEGGPPNEEWYARWSSRYWNAGLGTATAYGAHSGATLAQRMPAHHRQFLQGLPWFAELDGHFFVHAGLRTGPVAAQRDELAARSPLRPTFMHDPLREKALATVEDPSWGCVVVSGHTKRPAKYARTEAMHAPHFITEHRITLSAEVDATGHLFAIALLARVIYKVAPTGQITTKATR